ncbi:HD domain-containing protein [Caldisalinibacter kiritimatiensis]|uniref:Exopolyphosphatase n=1 Tax=Caldisalinibacter kiritimatiensis TaxID=1304284 RepID=R1CXP4_9FIRM|nr:HD domain-containing protein [Caldisalinibacter kiritimatiensis]EOD01379.1 Exopolyphosphatase [Caldisalinibacter kiritimatiensis]
MSKDLNSELIAGIDIGSHSIKMKIAEINENGEIRTLDNLRRTASLGKDTFTTGKISFKTVDEICEILKGYKQVLNDYRIKQYRAVATSAVREATNKDYVVDQIKLKTGLHIEVITNSEEKYLTYKSIRDNLKDYKRFRNERTLIVDVGSGNTEMTSYNKGKLQFSQSIKLGALRIREILASLERRTLHFSKILEEYIESNLDTLKIFSTQKSIKNFIAVGGEISIISRICNETKDKEKSKYIDRNKFIEVYNELMYKPYHHIIKEYDVPENRIEILIPSLILFKKFIDMTDAKGIYVPLVSLRDGLISDFVDKKYNTNRDKKFREDIISSAIYLAKRYKSDMKHVMDVMDKSMIIFDRLKDIHGLGEKERFMLQLAAILHDIGKYVNLVDHYDNSYDIILASDLIGMSDRQMEIIANVARYHGEKLPKFKDRNYDKLSEKDKLIISKLSAMLKLANSLDMSHKQKIWDIDVNTDEKIVVITARTKEDVLLEIWTFEANSDLFKEVFGVVPILKIDRVM